MSCRAPHIRGLWWKQVEIWPVMQKRAPSWGFPSIQTLPGSATERMVISCHCKVQVPLLPRYIMEIGSKPLSFLSQPPLFLQSALPSASMRLYSLRSTGFEMRRLFLWEPFCAYGSLYRFQPIIHTMHCQVTISNAYHMGPKFCTSWTQFQPQNLEAQIVLWFILIWSHINKRPGRYSRVFLVRSSPLSYQLPCLCVPLLGPVLGISLFPAWTPSLIHI